MKKIFAWIMLVMVMMLLVLPVLAEDYNMPLPGEVSGQETTPFTWVYLATITGATMFTTMLVQFFKFPLDNVWKIPTRLLVYVIAFLILLIATAFSEGLTLSNAALAASNALIVALAAMGAYETIAKPPEKKD